mgnify:CR=1 FL=1
MAGTDQPVYTDQVHPRIRGEYILVTKSLAYIAGSPPHTRGIWFNWLIALQICRFTPAYAGNIAIVLFLIVAPEVHPRIRGEYFDDYKGQDVILGSPPHTRGIFVVVCVFLRGFRFTPAYAGNIISTYWIY